MKQPSPDGKIEMETIKELLESCDQEVTLRVTTKQLTEFASKLAKELMATSAGKQTSHYSKSTETRLLTRQEVRALCGVCDSTLWNWSQRNYLVPVKIGNKARYREADVLRIINNQ